MVCSGEERSSKVFLILKCQLNSVCVFISPSPYLKEQVRSMCICHAYQEGYYSSLITGFVKRGEPLRALTLYQKTQEDDSLHPNGSTFVALLKACSMLKDLSRGCELHADISKRGLLERDAFVCSSIVDMYAKCGSLSKAQAVFDRLPVRDVVLWTALISGYAECGCVEDAFQRVEQMRRDKIPPNEYTLVCCLKACGSIGAVAEGEKFYTEIISKGLDGGCPVGNTLVDMYTKFGLLPVAQHILSKLPVRNKVSWTALITGHAEHGNAEDVLHLVDKMQDEGIPPDAFTYVSSLKACGSICAIIKGQEIHTEVTQKGFELELLVGNVLVDMYAKCGLLADAEEVFDKLPVRNVVPFTSLITEFTEKGHGNKALNCLDRMSDEGISPETVTLICGLKACGSIEAVEKGQQIHNDLLLKGLETEPLVGNTLVDMYVKCVLFAEAQEVFDRLTCYDVVSWTAFIAGYVKHGHGEEALYSLEQMQQNGICMNAVTFVCCLKACGDVGVISKGQELHMETVFKGLEGELLICITLIDMYVDFDLLADAEQIFDKVPHQDTVSWNALITGYGQLGKSAGVFEIFDRMIYERVQPDNVTFMSVLNACSHAGLLYEGEMFFGSISNYFGSIPTLEHHTCLVDILGRVGLVEKARATVEDMPFHPDSVTWHTVLGACQKWSQVGIARNAFENAVWLDGRDGAAYVCMSNIYSGADVHDEAIKVEALRLKKQAR
ncbi:hypothetical protein GOP47_0027927 [Adiantum capillus-veneris]|nr:hypothetical protein GOP47_0027927 [Adiantum capillus-veneris]